MRELWPLESGTFGGNGAVTIGGASSSWTGGQIDLGSGGFTNTGTLAVDVNPFENGLALSGPDTFTNLGAINFAGYYQYLVLRNGAALNNAAGATFELGGYHVGVLQAGEGSLNNAGTLEVDGTVSIASSLINSGAITVQNGDSVLTLSGPSVTSLGGTFNLTDYSQLDLTGGATVTYQGDFNGTGDETGTIFLDSGTLKVGSGGATFNMVGIPIDWTGGTIDVSHGSLSNSGTFRIGSYLNNPIVLTGGGILINNSTITQILATTLSLERGAKIDNTVNGTYEIEDAGIISLGATSSVTNAGLLEVAAVVPTTYGGTSLEGTASIGGGLFKNSGTVEITSGTLGINSKVADIGSNDLSAGTWMVEGTASVPSELEITSGSFTTLGSKASVVLSGPNATFTNLSGLANIGAGASFSLEGGASFTTAGALTNRGTLVLGAGSVLTVVGNFVSASTAALITQIGIVSGTYEMGQIVVPIGTASLKGTVSVTATAVVQVGYSLEVVNNVGNTSMSGIFKGLPNDATFTVDDDGTTMTFEIKYVGADEVVIKRIS